MSLKDLMINVTKITEMIPEDYSVSDSEYFTWKIWYESLPEHEKIFHLLGAVSEFTINPSHSGASIFASALVCTQRWLDEKFDEEF